MQRFQASRPGHRFQERYRRRQRSSGGRLGSAGYMVGGAVIAVVSLLLAPLPGPGMLTVLLGLGMVAGEFRAGARLLDWSEVRARRLAGWVGNVWRSSAGGKALVASVAAICAAAVLYVAYLLLFGG